MNFYKRHLGDYAKDAGHLSMLEHGAYTLLLDRYYTTERPIPNRSDAYRICRARSRDEKEAVDTVLREFFVAEGDAFVNRRAEEEIAKAAHQRSVNQEIGKRGGRPKKTDPPPDPGTDSETDSVIRPETDSVQVRNPSQTPLATKVLDKPIPQGGVTARGTRLPPNWDPGESGFAFAESHGLTNGKALSELEKFRDWWAAVPGQKGVKLDWQATWRTWVRRAVENGQGAASTPSKPADIYGEGR